MSLGLARTKHKYHFGPLLSYYCKSRNISYYIDIYKELLLRDDRRSSANSSRKLAFCRSWLHKRTGLLDPINFPFAPGPQSEGADMDVKWLEPTNYHGFGSFPTSSYFTVS